MALALKLATPTRLVVSAEADEVVVPGVEGYFGVLPGHAAFLTTLGTGELTYTERGHQWPLAVSGGLAPGRGGKGIGLAAPAARPGGRACARAPPAPPRPQPRPPPAPPAGHD